MDVLTAVCWAAGVLVVVAIFVIGLAFVAIAGLIALRMINRKATAAGIDLSDGIDERELKLITGMITRQKQTAAEQAVAVEMVNAAQASLQKSAAKA